MIRRRAAEQGARLIEVDSAYRISGLRAKDLCYRFIAAPQSVASPGADKTPLTNTGAGKSREIEIALPLAGRFQVRNALTAMTAARLLAERGFPIDDARHRSRPRHRALAGAS